jgi:hypothetical protein
MNRKQRRAAARQQTVSLPKSQEKLIAGMYKNGITDKDLKAEWYKGVEAGRAEGIYSCYAATILAAKDEFKFGKKRLMRLIRRLDQHVCDTLSSKEAIDNVYEKTGIRITFANPFGYVEEA